MKVLVLLSSDQVRMHQLKTSIELVLQTMATCVPPENHSLEFKEPIYHI